MTGAVDLSRLVAKANGNIDTAVRQTVVLAAQGVVMNSPVLTGRLRSSWGFGVNQPSSGPTDTTDKAGGATLTKIARAVQGQEAGPKFYITTALPYARRIEYEGWSKSKSPQGMVRITIANLSEAIRQYVNGELKRSVSNRVRGA